MRRFYVENGILIVAHGRITQLLCVQALCYYDDDVDHLVFYYHLS